MSQGLTPFNVAGLTVGQSGSIDLTQVMNIGGLNPNNKPTIRLHNDSGSGLYVVLPNSSTSFNLPAGGWQDVKPQPGETAIEFTVLYLLPNPPVTLFMATFYGPNEEVPPMTILGNSPVGVGGTINTSNTTLVNDGNAPGSTLIESTPSDAASSTWKADNSGNLTVKGDNAGTLTTLIQLIAGASPGVKLAAAAVLTEVLGTLQVDGTSTFTGLATHNGGIASSGGAVTLTGNGSSALHIGAHATGDILDVNGDITYIKSPNGVEFQVPSGTSIVDILPGSTGGARNNGGQITVSQINLQVGGFHESNSGTGLSGTINHGLNRIPRAVLVCCDSTSSSATVGAYSYTSTQFGMTIGSSLDGRWWAFTEV